MSIKKDLLALRHRLEHIDDDLVKLLCEEFDFLQKADLTNADAIKVAYEASAKRYMSLVGEIGNRGQDLSLRRHAICLCFAINPCIQYKDEGDFCRMDPENECIAWLKKMMFYSALLDGGTTDLDPDVAAKIFDSYINVFDSMLVCCRGTDACPKGNEWSVMEAQLKNLSEAHGLQGKDRTSFWWLYGAIGAGWRVAYNYAHSRQPYFLCYTSLRNLEYMYDNPTESILSNPLVNTFLLPHPQAQMSHLANLLLYPLARNNRFRGHLVGFLEPLNGIQSHGTEVRAPAYENLEFFLRRAKISDCTPEEIAARTDILRRMQREAGAVVANMWDLILTFWPKLQDMGMDDREAASFIGDVCGDGYGNMVLSKIEQSKKWEHIRQLQAYEKTSGEIVESVRQQQGDNAADDVKRLLLGKAKSGLIQNINCLIEHLKSGENSCALIVNCAQPLCGKQCIAAWDGVTVRTRKSKYAAVGDPHHDTVSCCDVGGQRSMKFTIQRGPDNKPMTLSTEAELRDWRDAEIANLESKFISEANRSEASDAKPAAVLSAKPAARGDSKGANRRQRSLRLSTSKNPTVRRDVKQLADAQAVKSIRLELATAASKQSKKASKRKRHDFARQTIDLSLISSQDALAAFELEMLDHINQSRLPPKKRFKHIGWI
jgi:hypothetical protein